MNPGAPPASASAPRPAPAGLRLHGADEPDAQRWRSIAERANRLYGAVPETLRVMTIGTNAAEIYLTLSEANDACTLSPLEREYVAIQTARSNGCQYCFTAHLARALILGADAQALNELGTRSFGSRIDAVLAFAASALQRRGLVTDDQVAAARAAGLDDRTLVDIAAVVIENLLGNTINNLAGTPPEPGVERLLASRGVTTAGPCYPRAHR
jgi:AhpD family alkylhydroperoxidase